MNEETKEGQPATDNTGEGVQSETDKRVEQLNADTERINKAIAENEHAQARQRLGGQSEAGRPSEKPKELTDSEYTKKVMSGEFNE